MRKPLTIDKRIAIYGNKQTIEQTDILPKNIPNLPALSESQARLKLQEVIDSENKRLNKKEYTMKDIGGREIRAGQTVKHLEVSRFGKVEWHYGKVKKITDKSVAVDLGYEKMSYITAPDKKLVVCAKGVKNE